MSSIDGSQVRGSLGHQRLVVPESLRQQLLGFRSKVWLSKMLEAVVIGSVAVLLAFLTVYLFDRFLDTPRNARALIFFGSLATWLIVPWALHRWVWSNRKLDQVARLLRVREPSVGDQLLSVIELADNEAEQARSRALCAAAISQVAEAARQRDFGQAAPPTRLKSLSLALGASAGVALALAVLFPSAASNAWARFAMPWKNTPRYTFTSVEAIPERMVLPHGELVPFSIRLSELSQWEPKQARLQIGSLPPLAADLDADGSYRFELPPQTADTTARIAIGDFLQVVRLEPKLRPELTEAIAEVTLPAYLERPEVVKQDVRSGVLAAVQGSVARVSATASRPLQSASVGDRSLPVEKSAFRTDSIDLGLEPSSLQLSWMDHDGLAGRAPFDLAFRPSADEYPSVLSQDLPRQAVVLDSEQINFQALAADDFGVKRIGMSWRGLDDRLVTQPANGEKLIAAGGAYNSSMQVPATFCASDLGIAPQPIELRLWAEDYMPGRERVESPAHILYVLTAEEHAIWITSQLSKWHRESLDVRDKEMQLHATNKRLRESSPEELQAEELKNELRRQSSLEAANGRRLTALSKAGENLLRQAARNPEIGVGHLDRWAEMLQILNDIGSNRMPSVSDLLDQASKEQQLASSGESKQQSAPGVGNIRSTSSSKGQPQEQDPNMQDAPKMPSIVDRESSLHPNEAGEENDEQPPKKKKGNGSRLGLAKTTISGPAKSGDQKPEEEEDEEDDQDAMGQALFEQEELLAEFEKIADELNTLLANMEGSTLVKRLKAASREQNQVAEKIGSRIEGLFGMASQFEASDKQMLKDLSEVEEQSSQTVSYIMDDMQSYFERRRMNQFKLVLDEMKKSEVLVALQKLGEELPKEHGLSIAQAEYWADTLDRWADDLVDPACSGQCPGSKTSDALPPSLILEVLKILDGEINLREATRVTNQARPDLDNQTYQTEANKLASTQSDLRERTDAVVAAIVDLPEGESRFGKEISLLAQVSTVMLDAQNMLADFNTGSRAIAAETEAIELLLECKRINPKGGGGGGSSPGGGGTGTTQDSALALLGSGLNQNERRDARDVMQATGESSRVLPEEFRAGLDAYFEKLEQGLR
jgi:hypothetical protein